MIEAVVVSARLCVHAPSHPRARVLTCSCCPSVWHTLVCFPRPASQPHALTKHDTNLGFVQFAKVTADFIAEAEAELTIKTGDAVLCMLRAACGSLRTASGPAFVAKDQRGPQGAHCSCCSGTPCTAYSAGAHSRDKLVRGRRAGS